MEYLDKNEVARRIGVKPRTAATLMMEMNPIPISGTVRIRYRVTEESFNAWMMRRMMGKPKAGTISKGSNRKLERR